MTLATELVGAGVGERVGEEVGRLVGAGVAELYGVGAGKLVGVALVDSRELFGNEPRPPYPSPGRPTPRGQLHDRPAAAIDFWEAVRQARAVRAHPTAPG